MSAVKGLSIKHTSECPSNFDNCCASSIQWGLTKGSFRRSQAQSQSDWCHTQNSCGLGSFQYRTEIMDIWNYFNKKIESVENKRFGSRVYTLTDVRCISLASYDLWRLEWLLNINLSYVSCVQCINLIKHLDCSWLRAASKESSATLKSSRVWNGYHGLQSGSGVVGSGKWMQEKLEKGNISASWWLLGWYSTWISSSWDSWTPKLSCEFKKKS